MAVDTTTGPKGKLEFLVAAALAEGADTLVTCGAPQSNHCRITLGAAVKEGLKCRFVIEERVAGGYDPKGNGNHLMFRLLGVEATARNWRTVTTLLQMAKV